MEKAQSLTVEIFIENWNQAFPKYTLSAADLKKPHELMEALFQLFDRLGIDTDAVLAPPPEEDRSQYTDYYWDLLPVINMTRIINHLVSVMPQMDATITVTHFFQPTAITSHSILLLLFNLMLFNEERLAQIAPEEEKLFARDEEVKSLEAKKNKLLEMRNEQAQEKAKRAQKIEKLQHEIKELEEKLKYEKKAHDEEKLIQESLAKERAQIEAVVEQKILQKNTLMAEVEEKKALRVYDADEINAKYKQATQNVQDADEKLNSLRLTLMEKENSLKNLQTIQPNLDTANNLIREITKLTQSLKDYEAGDFDSDSKEGELDVLSTSLGELQLQLGEVRAARAAGQARRQLALAARQHDATLSDLREAQERDKKDSEHYKKAAKQTEEIKQVTFKYQEQKAALLDELANIKTTFCSELKSSEEILLKRFTDAESTITDKLRKRNGGKQ